MISQALKLVLRTGSIMVLARMLSPDDFGLQGMVVAMTGFLGLFRDAGLSMAAVQRDVLTHEQASTLFWINAAVGVLLSGLAAAMAPALVGFYHDPRLFWITIISGSVFLINGVAAQHVALLQRSMRFVVMAKIELLALAVSCAVGVVMAMRGLGYWALVGMAVSAPIISTLGILMAVPWMPGFPQRGVGVRAMLRFGGTVTCNGLVVYLAYNIEKVLLGRFWGAEVLGIYGRAYQLINLPLEQLASSANSVAFSTFSRIQSDSERLCRVFLKQYSVLLSLSVPITLSCGIFAEEFVRVMLGTKWLEAVPIFRLLLPTMVVFSLINPFGVFMNASGRAGRSLRIALMIAPVAVLGILAGLPYGAQGVALGYSAAMVILAAPVIAWATHGTGITARSYWETVRPVLLSGLAAAVGGWAVRTALGGSLAHLPLLLVGSGVILGTYASIILFVLGQKATYLDLVSQVFRRGRG